MADIVERIGFEVANAIANLNALQTAIKSVNTSLLNFGKAASKASVMDASTSMKSLSDNAKVAGDNLKTVGEKADAAGKSAAKTGKSLTISWQTFARVVMTQALVRSINNVTQAISNAAETAGQFQVDVARMAQITPEGSAGIGYLTESLDGLSITLGRDIGEVSEAAFEALQNDLGNTKETMDLLGGAASDLALVTGSTLKDSINSISSVIKSYNMNIGQSNDIADTFFVAIDKGRVTLSELESRLGTVTPQAAALGISFQDSASAVASLTLSGLNSATAMTQLRNILAKLIKPTDDLKAAYKTLGVTSGNELVQKFGSLQGALAALKQAFGNNDQAVAKAFGTIRGQLGILNLLANEGTNFIHVLEAMENRSGRAADAAKEIDKVSYRELQKQQEKLNDTLREAGELYNQLKLKALEYINAVLGAPKNLASDIAKDTTDALKTVQSKVAKEYAEGQKKLATQIAAEAAVAPLSGKALADYQEMLAVQFAIEERLLKQNLLMVQGNSNLKILKDSMQEYANLAKEASQVSTLEKVLSGGTPAQFQEMQAFVERFNQQIQAYSERIAKGDTSQQLKNELGLLEERMDKFIDQYEVSDQLESSLRGQYDSLRQTIPLVSRNTDLVNQRKEGEQLLNQIIQEETRLLESAGTKMLQLKNNTQETTNAIKAIPNPVVDTSAAINNLQRLREQALLTAQAVAATSGGVSAYHGRPIYRAAGGRGLDTQPAMLSPGEFVMNARSSRKFFSQLQAINSGQSPIYRDQGGPVTNIGDINVNVTGGAGSENPNRFGKQIANSLRRELRRKTSAL